MDGLAVVHIEITIVIIRVYWDHSRSFRGRWLLVSPYSRMPLDVALLILLELLEVVSAVGQGHHTSPTLRADASRAGLSLSTTCSRRSDSIPNGIMHVDVLSHLLELVNLTPELAVLRTKQLLV